MDSESLVVNEDGCKGVTVNFDKLSDNNDIPELIGKYGTVLRFPEKLMLLLIFIETTCTERGQKPEEACLSWSPDGKALIIRNHDELVKQLLPQVFHTRGSFTSFTRKLYRWGFRQKDFKSKKGKPSAVATKVFFHKLFQRDAKKLMTKMRSATADRETRTNTLPSPEERLRQLETTPLSSDTKAICQTQNWLAHRLTASTLDSLQQHKAVTLADLRHLSFDAFSLPSHSQAQYLQPILSPGLMYGIEPSLFQRAFALGLKQTQATADVRRKQIQVLANALKDLAEFDKKKQLATVRWSMSSL